MRSSELLDAGRAILEPPLLAAAFRFESSGEAKGRRGPFARAAFVRGARCLEFSVRRGLGEVVYRQGAINAPHELLVLSLRGHRGAYPGFSDDPLDGFRRLRADLEVPLELFLSGTDSEVTTVLVVCGQLLRPRNLAAWDAVVP